MLEVNKNFFNWVFNTDIGVPKIDSITIDEDRILAIDDDIVTVDNVWNMLVLQSLITEQSNRTVLVKDDVLSAEYEAYSGKSVKETVVKLLLVSRDGDYVPDTYERLYKRNTVLLSKYPSQ